MPAVNRLILGTVQFGLKYGINNDLGKPSAKEVSAILDYAFNHNIRLLDSAEAYGDAQEMIGRYHDFSSNRFEIVTKFSPVRKDLPDNITDRIHQNMDVLRVKSLYCYMFHSFRDFKTYYDKYNSELENLLLSGVIKKLGVSVYRNDEIEELLDYNIGIIQLPFNLLDNSHHRAIILKQAKEKGIEIHTRSAFLQGLFFMDINHLPVRLMSLAPYLRELKRISIHYELGLNILSLNYILRQKFIDHVLIGVDSLMQLKDNVSSLQAVIPEDVFDEIDSIHVTDESLLNPSTWNI